MGLRRQQSGQSMTEFVVTAAFVTVPLFIIVPTVAKYVDMKLAAVQAARYATWEYTAYYSDMGNKGVPTDQPIGFNVGNSYSAPYKSLSQTANEAKRRFYSDTRVPINSVSDKAGYKDGERNSLWTYHNGMPMYQEGSQGKTALVVKGSDPTPDKLKVLNFLVGLIGKVFDIVADFNAKIGVKAGFDAMNPDGNVSVDGMYRTTVAMKVEPAPGYTGLNPKNAKPLFLTDLKLEMKAKTGLLTENWGAGGRAHTVYQSSGLILTPYLDFLLNGWGIPLQTIASTVLISPELDKSSLKFGYPVHDPKVMDIVPVGKLQGDTRKVSCDGNYCIED